MICGTIFPRSAKAAGETKRRAISGNRLINDIIEERRGGCLRPKALRKLGLLGGPFRHLEQVGGLSTEETFKSSLASGLGIADLAPLRDLEVGVGPGHGDLLAFLAHLDGDHDGLGRRLTELRARFASTSV